LFDVRPHKGKLSRLCLDGHVCRSKEDFLVADEINDSPASQTMLGRAQLERTRLINDITRLIREPMMPEATRTAGLTLIGWLARRRSSELPDAIGVPEARESERRLRAARKAAR
jgi:hypothetical protein